jgi:hypothetical protein
MVFDDNNGVIVTLEVAIGVNSSSKDADFVGQWRLVVWSGNQGR